MIARPKRYLEQKSCNRCEKLKLAEEFPKVRGGGTADVCKECKAKAVSASMIEKYRIQDEFFRKRQEEHFKKDLEAQQKRWDSLPDGHPYKAPKRPGSTQ